MSNVTCGIPQCSVLEPLLFILYVNDMLNVSHLLKFVLYADAANFVHSTIDINQLDAIVNAELNKLYTWFQVNKLSLIVSNSNFITFKNRDTQHLPDIVISDYY